MVGTTSLDPKLIHYAAKLVDSNKGRFGSGLNDGMITGNNIHDFEKDGKFDDGTYLSQFNNQFAGELGRPISQSELYAAVQYLQENAKAGGNITDVSALRDAAFQQAQFEQQQLGFTGGSPYGGPGVGLPGMHPTGAPVVNYFAPPMAFNSGTMKAPPQTMWLGENNGSVAGGFSPENIGDATYEQNNPV